MIILHHEVNVLCSLKKKMLKFNKTLLNVEWKTIVSKMKV